MQAYDLREVLRDLPELAITENTTNEEASAAVGVIAPFNQGILNVMRFSGLTPWEKHPQDELLHILDGEVEVTLLSENGSETMTVAAGSIMVIPQGVWHRQFAKAFVTILFATPQPSDFSFEDDPYPAR